MAELKLPLVRTVFLPKGSPGICTVREVRADIRRSEVRCADGKIFCAGEADLLIEYLSCAGEGETKKQYANAGDYLPGGGKMWQALVTLPFELVEQGEIACPPLSGLQVAEVKWFMVAPHALEMELQLALSWQEQNAEAQPNLRAQRGGVDDNMEREDWEMESLLDENSERRMPRQTWPEEPAPELSRAANLHAQGLREMEARRLENEPTKEWGVLEREPTPAAAENWQEVRYQAEEDHVPPVAAAREREAGLAERAAGEAERAEGMREIARGLAARDEGLAEQAAGEAEREAGLAERAAGEAERAAGLREQEAGDAAAAELLEIARAEAERQAGLAEQAAGVKGNEPRVVFHARPEPQTAPQPERVNTAATVEEQQVNRETARRGNRRRAHGIPHLEVKGSRAENEAARGYQVNFYVVCAGDTWAAIAAQTGCSAQRIIELNGLENQKLEAGMSLRLPS